MTARFRSDNTEGYSEAELAELNAAYETILAAVPPEEGEDTESIHFKSWEDSISERLLALYDAGVRGDELTKL